jgi:hypothetical protein
MEIRMHEDTKVVKVAHYKHNPVWEWAGYIGIITVFALWVVTLEPLFVYALTAMLLYWNYTLFMQIKMTMEYVNHQQIKDLAFSALANELNKHKDGTISDREGLTKESEDER